MVGMLESRRRIFYGMENIFGNNSNIAKMDGSKAAPDDAAMISAMDSWAHKGADPHNLALYTLFLDAQHSLSSILPAYGGGEGWIFSGQDQLAFTRFRMVMDKKLSEYQDQLNGQDGKIKALPEFKAFQNTVNGLIAEYQGTSATDTQPYITGENVGVDFFALPARMWGWDSYSQLWTGNDDYPVNANPNAMYGGQQPHLNLVSAQITGVNLTWDRKGTVSPITPGSYAVTGLAGRNWALHDIMKLLSYSDTDIGRDIAISTQNFRASSKIWERTGAIL